MLGISSDDISFDNDLIPFTNGALNIVNQLGVGPSTGFVITDSSQKWSDFMGERKDLEIVKSDIFLRVRLIFDPPQNSFLVSAIQKQIEEFDWRIEAHHIEEPVSPVEE